jgi:hypothetical protein
LCECCVLSGLCEGLITRPEESYRLWCVVVCDLEASRMRRPWPALGRRATGKKSTIRVLTLFDDECHYPSLFSQPTISENALIYELRCFSGNPTVAAQNFLLFVTLGWNCIETNHNFWRWSLVSIYYRRNCALSSFFCGAATLRGSWPPHSWGF